MSGKRLTALSLLILVASLGSPSSARADTVTLKNGRKFPGCKIVIDNVDFVSFETAGGITMRFPKSQVASIDKDSQPNQGPKKPAEDIPIPDGATDEDVEKLRSLIPTCRNTVRRLEEARKDKAEGEKAGGKDGAERARLADERIKELESELAKLKKARDAIEKSAAERYEKQKLEAKLEAADLRAESDKIQVKDDAAGLADRAQKLRERGALLPARDPRRPEIFAESLRCMEAAAKIELAKGREMKVPEERQKLLLRAADRFSWCSKNGEGQSRSLGSQAAVDACSEAHRMLRPSDSIEKYAEIERTLAGLQAYSTLAALVTERLDARRWGDAVGENEALTFKLELKNGNTQTVNEVPTTNFANIVWERREKAPESVKEGGFRKVAYWYALVWDPAKKRWARESPATQLEASKLIPLLKTAQERVEGLTKAQLDRDAADKARAEKHAATVLARSKADLGDGPQDEVEKCAQAERKADRDLAVMEEKLTAAKAALEEKKKELSELQQDLDRAQKGPS